MSSGEAASTSSAAAHDMVRALEDACSASAELIASNQIEAIEPRTIQQLVRTAIKLYIAKRESGCDFDPVAEGDLTATDVSETATGLLRAVRLEPFELGWWRRLGQI
jgi:hypothetical protein